MFDKYYDKCERMILPSHRSVLSFNIINNNNHNGNSNSFTPKHKEMVHTSSSSVKKYDKEIHELRKNKMFLKQDKLNLECEIMKLKQENKELKSQIEILQDKSIQNRNYILSLEKVIEKTTTNISKRKSYSSNQMNNILSNNNRIKSKNKDSLIKELKRQNEKLLSFKEQIFSLSTELTTINQKVLNIITQIGNYFNNINNNSIFDKINITFNTVNTSFQNIKANVEELLTYIIKDNELRHKEYLIMLKYKDDIINELQDKLNKFEHNHNELQHKVNDKNEIITRQQNQIKVYKELLKKKIYENDTNNDDDNDDDISLKTKMIKSVRTNNSVKRYNNINTNSQNNNDTGKNNCKRSCIDILKDNLNTTVNKIEQVLLINTE